MSYEYTGQGLVITGKLDAKTQRRIDEIAELDKQHQEALTAGDKVKLFELAEVYRRRGMKRTANQIIKECYDL